MRVEVVRRGGVAGVAEPGSIDPSELPPRVADDAVAALTRLPFAQPPAPPRHPDSFQYEITVVEGEERRRAVLDEAQVPAALHPLLEAALERG
jgi:hypothetical protein